MGISKGWPEDESEALPFEKITAPLRRLVREAYRLQRKNVGKALPYKGPGIGWRERACTSDVDWTLSAEGLAYHAERGRDAMDVILMVAVQLGIEQGRRISAPDKKLEDLLSRLIEREENNNADPV
jgi:hypothetical protein